MRARVLGVWLVFMGAVGCGTVVIEPSPIDSGQPERDSGSAPLEDSGVSDRDAGAPDAGVSQVDSGVADSGSAEVPDPVLFVHGINPGADDFAVMKARLVDAGWPANRLFSRKFSDPSWGCNKDNASTIAGWVADALAATGATRVDLVAHSMGSLSSRYFMKHLGGPGRVRTYLTLGGMHHGLSSSCASPLDVCVWKELCSTGPFVADLNESGPNALGPTKWISISSTDDGTVPAASSTVYGAENIVFSGISHVGLLTAPNVQAEVERVLRYSL